MHIKYSYLFHTHTLLAVLCVINSSTCEILQGPDPWNSDNKPLDNVKYDVNIPPDLRLPSKKRTEENPPLGNGEWFFKRMLGIVLRGGQVKTNEEGSVDVSLRMKFSKKEWESLDIYLKSTALTDEMFRRSLGYIEQAIYRPSITEQIVTAWSDHIQIYLSAYKIEISWVLSILAAAGVFVWLWNHMSHRHLVMAIFISLYLYEVFTSYKEAEKQELDRFLSAVNSCKWMIWSSSCEVPTPDPLIFIKHMNPLKIGVRMFSTMVSEPLIILSDTLKIMVHGLTDGLWYPFDKIVYGILILTFNVLLLFLIILALLNYILNIPFNLNLFGFIGVALKQRNRNQGDSNRRHSQPLSPGDRLSGATIDRLLDVCSKALTAVQTAHPPLASAPSEPETFALKRSASTGRLPDLNKLFENNNKALTHWQRHDKNRSNKGSFGTVTKRNAYKIRGLDGSGDAS